MTSRMCFAAEETAMPDAFLPDGIVELEDKVFSAEQAYRKARANGPDDDGADDIDIHDLGLDDWSIPPRGWLLGNVFCRRMVSSLSAPGAGGKTSLRIAQLLSCATDRQLTGDHVFQRCRVLIVG